MFFSSGHSLQTMEEQSINNSSISWWNKILTNWKNNQTSYDDKLMCIGSMIVKKLRNSIFNNLTFSCSAGIATTKTLAKLACGLHKPAQQTLGKNTYETDIIDINTYEHIFIYIHTYIMYV